MLIKVCVRTLTITGATLYISFLFVISYLGLRRIWALVFERNKPYIAWQAPLLCRWYFELLGPTFIKLGQIIASSPGLFSESLSAEFKKCLDSVPPFPVEDAYKVLNESFDRPWSEIYSEFDPVPIAAASIAQVHRARLKSGEEVVIKIQRPGIRNLIDADLWFMSQEAWIAQKLSKRARLANVVGIIDDFSTTIIEELDFLQEAANINEFNSIMKQHGIEDVIAPYVYLQYTTERILTMEIFHGFRADDIEAANRIGIDSEYYLRVGMRAWLLTVILHGFFHGDVHAGNLMFLPEKKKIGFLDFGIIGRFDRKTRQQVVRYLLAFIVQDFDEVAKCMIDMGSAPEDVDIKAFSEQLNEVYTPLFAGNIADISYSEFLPKITDYATRFGVKLPREFILILKQLLYFDRYAKLAAPDLNIFGDLYLFDFLFTPAAQEAGIDTQQIMELMMKAQAIKSNLAK